MFQCVFVCVGRKGIPGSVLIQYEFGDCRKNNVATRSIHPDDGIYELPSRVASSSFFPLWETPKTQNMARNEERARTTLFGY